MKKKITALLCDLDGVLTNTSELHAKTWKLLFDELHQKLNDQSNAFVPGHDFPLLIDGKPRYEGIRSYLMAKQIQLPEGDAQDSENEITVMGLAKKKNSFFHKYLREEGAKPIPASIETIKLWKEKGLKLAVVSSSKNCQKILEVAGISDLFEVVVDGITGEEKQLPGKPEPNTFNYAAELLGVQPSETAIAEDAGAGIEAAIKGNYGLSIGVLTENNAEYLHQSDPDTIVKDLSEIIYTGESLRYSVPINKLEHAFRSGVSLIPDGLKPVFFFDYDGTLTPIVSRPENALLNPVIKKKLTELAARAPLTIISGRDKEDVKKMVGIGNVYYAGSHGYDIEGPNNVAFTLPEGEKYISSIKEVTANLKVNLSSFEGVQIEPKKFAVAVHYRNAKRDDFDKIRKVTEEVVNKFSELKIGEGKMVLEVRPAIDWDKGKAMHWVSSNLGMKKSGTYHFYIGDDITDEDAFKVLPENGTGILIGDHGTKTYADFRLDDPNETEHLIDHFISLIKEKE